MIDVVLAASGIGKRLGAKIPKQYLMLHDKTILQHTYEALISFPQVHKVIIVINKNDNFFKDLALSSDSRVITAIGGDERQDSVLNGLKLCSSDYVMVHDAARPFIQRHDLEALALACSDNCPGAILACKVADTIKESHDGCTINTTVPRDSLYRALTPQMFKRELLLEALTYAHDQYINITDEASAMSVKGHQVKLVMGESSNFKITDAADLQLAEALILLREKNKCE